MGKYLGKHIGVYKVVAYRDWKHLILKCKTCNSFKTIHLAAVTKCKYKTCKCNYGYKWNNIWKQIKYSAKLGNRKLKVTIQQIEQLLVKQNNKCALSGVSISVERRNSKIKTTASLDRIDSSKDYTIDNVQWVHKDINRMKSDFKQTRFIELCKKVGQYGA